MRRGTNKIPKSSVQQVGRPCANPNQPNPHLGLYNPPLRYRNQSPGRRTGLPAIIHPHHQNREATEAHSSLLALSHRSNCPPLLPEIRFLPSHATTRVRPHFLAPSPASPVRQRRPAPSSGWRRAEGAADPSWRCPAHLAARLPLAATAGRGGSAVLPLARAPFHPALAMVTTLGPPGEFQIPPPPAAPLPSGPGPQHSVGGPAPPPRQPPQLLHTRGAGSREVGGTWAGG